MFRLIGLIALGWFVVAYCIPCLLEGLVVLGLIGSMFN